MRSFLFAGIAALAIAAPAVAADDLLFPAKEATSLTAMAAHQPYWALLAECAGVYGAASNFERGRGNGGAADEDARIGTGMLNDAVARLKIDHNLSDHDALAYASDEVSEGHQQGADLLAHGDISGGSQWNWKRSACLDIQASYHRQVRRRAANY
jgi:hypothetical protein